MVKRFRKHSGRDYTTLKTELVRWVRRQQRVRHEDYFEALSGVNLTVPSGITMGIIGRNGSGKSTLLKLMTGIYRPTVGSVAVSGRVSALLELGAGFHPEFSGRENILINGVILGMSRAEVRARTPEIIRFSELGDFIDQPVRTYSSGMYMRLAFSVATHVDPDVLIVDEILAVGDDHFARKSLAKMLEFKQRGKTIVLVTHDLGSVERWCDRAAWLDGGRVREEGRPSDVVDRYRRAVFEAEMAGGLAVGPTSAPTTLPGGDAAPAATPAGGGAAAPSGAAARAPELPRARTGPEASPDQRFGTFEVEISALRLLGAEGREAAIFDPEGPMAIAIDFVMQREIGDLVFGIGIYSADGKRVYGTNTQVDRVELPHPLPRRGTLRIEMARLGFVDGDYSIEVAAHSRIGVNYDWQRGLHKFAVRSTIGDVGVARPPHRWVFEARPDDAVVPLAPKPASQGPMPVPASAAQS